MPRKEGYHKYLLQGICPHCKKNKIAEGKRACEDCLEKKRDHKRKRYNEDPEYRQRNLETHKKYRQRQKIIRIYGNLCSRCGKPLDDTHYATCEACRLYFRDYKRRHYERT